MWLQAKMCCQNENTKWLSLQWKKEHQQQMWIINEHTNSREQRYTTYRWCILHRIVNLSLIFVMRHTTRIHFVIETNWHTATKKNTKDNKNMFRQFNKILVWIGRNWSIKSKCRNQRQLVRLKLINFVVFSSSFGIFMMFWNGFIVEKAMNTYTSAFVVV